MDNRKQMLLQSLMKVLEDYDDMEDIALQDAEAEGTSFKVLRATVTGFGVQLLDAVVECVFMPIGNADEELYFSLVLTLADDLPAEHVDELAAAVARVNYILPGGCFAIGNADKNLVYRYTLPMTASSDDTQLGKQMELALDMGLVVAERFASSLALVALGQMSVEEMFRTIQIR